MAFLPQGGALLSSPVGAMNPQRHPADH